MHFTNDLMLLLGVSVMVHVNVITPKSLAKAQMGRAERGKNKHVHRQPCGGQDLGALVQRESL